MSIGHFVQKMLNRPPEWSVAFSADGYAEDAISAVDLAMRLVDAPA